MHTKLQLEAIVIASTLDSKDPWIWNELQGSVNEEEFWWRHMLKAVDSDDDELRHSRASLYYLYADKRIV